MIMLLLALTFYTRCKTKINIYYAKKYLGHFHKQNVVYVFHYN